jgi:hypothetical protein
MSQPDEQKLDAEQRKLDGELGKHPWFRGSYWGFPPGGGGAAPGWVVQVAAGHTDAKQAVAVAGQQLALAGAPVQVVVLTDGPRAYTS